MRRTAPIPRTKTTRPAPQRTETADPAPRDPHDSWRKMLRDRFLARVAIEVDEYFESPRYLWDARFLNHNLCVQDLERGKPHPDLFLVYIALFGPPPKELSKTHLAQRLTDLSILIANLAERRKQQIPVAIHMRKSRYFDEFAQYRRASFWVTKAAHRMAELGWVNLVEGKQVAKRVTRIDTDASTDPFWIRPVERFPVVYRAAQLLQLRKIVCDPDGKKKWRPVPYEETDWTRNQRALLRRLNNINGDVHVTFNPGGGPLVLDTDCYMVFNNGTWKHGGRIYASNLSHQNILSGLRPTILFDDRPTVELDFVAFHPRRLYAFEGIQYKSDPYRCLPHGGRTFGKLLVFVGLNTKNIHATVGVLTKKILAAIQDLQSPRKRRPPWYMDSAQPDEHGIELSFTKTANDPEFADWLNYLRTVEDSNPEKIKELVREAIDAFLAQHKRIAHYFHSMAGFPLMREDAGVSWLVCSHFAYQEEYPILPLFDGFIVAQQHADILEKSMQSSYRLVSGGFECPIKRTG